MPPFRIHQTRIRPERILVRLTQGKYILSSQLSQQQATDAIGNPVNPLNPVNAVNGAANNASASGKPKNVITLRQIKQIIGLLQNSNHKQLSQMLSPELSSLLSIKDEDVDKVEELEEEVVENGDPIDELELDEDEDLLIIDI